MKIYWKGSGSRHHGEYFVTWLRNVERESILYQVWSRVTRKNILTIEVF